MASLSTCHLGLWPGWQILLNLVNVPHVVPPGPELSNVKVKGTGLIFTYCFKCVKIKNFQSLLIDVNELTCYKKLLFNMIWIFFSTCTCCAYIFYLFTHFLVTCAV